MQFTAWASRDAGSDQRRQDLSPEDGQEEEVQDGAVPAGAEVLLSGKLEVSKIF